MDDLIVSDAEQAELWELWFAALREPGTLLRAVGNWAAPGTPVSCALVDGSAPSGGPLDYEDGASHGKTLYVVPGYPGAAIRTADRVEVKGLTVEVVAIDPAHTHQAAPAYAVVVR